MIRRGLELPPDRALPISLLLPSDDPRFQTTLPPGPEREAVVAELLEAAAEEASRLDGAALRFHGFVREYDPTQLIPSIAVPSRMGFPDPSAPDDAPLTFSWDAKVEYLAGIAVAGPPGEKAVDAEITQTAIELLAAVFDAARASLLTRSVAAGRSERDGVDSASFLLGLEHLLDRMAGYAKHLEQIAAEVFDPHRGFYTAELGFCPADAVRLVRRHTSRINSDFNEAQSTLSEAFARRGARVEDEASAQEAVLGFHQSLEATYRWTPDHIAESSSLPVDEVGNLMAAMSVNFGCQPDFRTPFDKNSLSYRPLIRLEGDEYLVPAPWSMAHRVHEWMQSYIAENPGSNAARRYPDHRSRAAERLVNARFADAFGSDAVFRGQHYQGADKPGEIDCLVATGHPIVTEVKSHSLTEPGRRGRPDRVERVADDVVGCSSEQTRRAARYLESGGRHFAPDQGAESSQLVPDEIHGVVRVAVSLERMDPLAAEARSLAGEESEDGGVWVTNLADLLMVFDVLDDPASVLHYAQTRADLHRLGIQVVTESDALGAYLVDRIQPVIQRAGDSDEHVMLGYAGDEINNFFTMDELGMPAEQPSSGVPSPITAALRSITPVTAGWAATALAIMTCAPSVWPRWRRFVRKHKSEHPFRLPGSEVDIVTSPYLKAAELRTAEGLTLCIPRKCVTATRG